MSDKVKHITIIEEIGYYGLEGQRVEDEEGHRLYCVYNLSECPEDAVIYRDLVSASEWIDAVRYGMRLAREGYTSIECSTVKDEDDEL